MDSGNIQHELFEFEKPKKTIFGLDRFFGKRDFENRFVLTITPEKLVFLMIGVIMLMVGLFALGVERGRSVGRQPAAAPVKKQATAPAKKKQPVLIDNARPFTIVASTFSNRSAATGEAKKLAASGFEIFVLQAGGYYHVCVGKFANKESAMPALIKIKQMFGQSYKDAYIKMRQGGS